LDQGKKGTTTRAALEIDSRSSELKSGSRAPAGAEVNCRTPN
jgi:hypothetical protein